MAGPRETGDGPAPPTLLERLGSFAAEFGQKAPRRRAVRVAVEAGLALLVFGFLVATVATQWSEIREQGVEFDLVWLLPALILMNLYYLLSGVVWGRILAGLGSPVTAGEAQRSYGQPLLVRYVPGTVLFLLARVLLAGRAGVSRRVATAGLVYELAISVAAALTIATWFLIVHPDLSDQWVRWLTLAVTPILILLLSPPVFGPLSGKLLALLGREPLPRTLGIGTVLVTYLMYVGLWSVLGAGAFFAARAAFPVEPDDGIFVISSQAIGYLAAIVSAVFPAGLGVRDAAFAWALKVALPGASFAVAAALALAVRATQTVAELIYVGLVTWLTRPPGRSGS